MRRILQYIAFSVIGLLFLQCSEKQENITTPETISVHKEGIGNPSSPNFHKAIFKSTNWDIRACQECHASDYSGGTTGKSCLKCHSSDNGPEACNTCHGDFKNPGNIAPPEDLHENTTTESPGVGAHQVHLALDKITGCRECHNNNSFSGVKYVYAHISGIDEDVAFSDFSNNSDNAGYNFSDYKCSNIYCHGNFAFAKDTSNNTFAYTGDKIEGNNYSPVWNKVDGTEAKCGTCHGEIDQQTGNLITATPKGHMGPYDVTSCGNCHTGIVNAQGEIIDFEKHINGKANVFGN